MVDEREQSPPIPEAALANCAALVRFPRLNDCVVGLMIKARQASEDGLVQDRHHDGHSTHHHQTVL